MKKITKIIKLIIVILIVFAYLLFGKKIIVNNKKLSTFLYNKSNNCIEPLRKNNNVDKETIEIGNIYYQYDNKYDEMVLNKDTNQNYKIITTTLGGEKAFVIAIYDASKISLLRSPFNTPSQFEHQTVLEMCKKNNAIIGINGGGFLQNERAYGIDTPKGYVIQDGKVVWESNKLKGHIIGFDKDNKLRLINATGEEALKEGIRDGLEFGPFLIVDGQVQDVPAVMSGHTRVQRSAIAQREDGIVLFVVTEGSPNHGPTGKELTDFLLNFGAINAANLDGGASSQLVENGKLLNNAIDGFNRPITYGRKIVTAWGLII